MSIHYTNTSNPIDFPKQSTVDRLWGEALDKAVPDTYSSLTWTQVEKIKTVFAELLIEKFDDILVLEYVDCIGNKDKQAEERVQRLREKVKTYFGVEE